MVEAACDCDGGVLALLRDITAAYASHDAERAARFLTEDVVFVDHRPLSTLSSHGREAAMDGFRATMETLPDFKVSVVVLAQDGDTYLARDTYDGHAAAGGGEALMQWWVVDTLRAGRLAREDIYATEDEARAEFEKRTVHPPS